MDIVRVEAKVSPAAYEQLITLGAEVHARKAAEQALSITGFHGHLCWPSPARGALCLIVEGQGEPDPLVETVQSLIGGDVSVRTRGEIPPEANELPPEGRSRLIIEMGLEGEGERCGSCGAIPPHVRECPWVFRDEGLRQAQDTTLYKHPPSLDVEDERSREPVPAH